MKQTKKILGSVLAVVLAFSLVLSFAACSKDGGEGDGASTSDVNQKAPADAASPQAQTFDALLTTVFESSDLNVDVTCDDGTNKETSDYNFAFGNGLEDSNFEIVISEDMKIVVAGTEIKVVENGKETSLSLTAFLGMTDIDTYLQMAGIDKPVNEVADDVISNGKVERSAIAYIYDNNIRPILEQSILEETGATVKLPSFEDSIAYIREFLNTGVSKEALNFTVVEEANGTVTYNATFNAGKLVEDFGKFVMKHTDLKAIAEAIAQADDCTVEEYFGYIVEEFNEIPGGSFQVTLANERLTKIVCTPNGGDTYTFEISSKK